MKIKFRLAIAFVIMLLLPLVLIVMFFFREGDSVLHFAAGAEWYLNNEQQQMADYIVSSFLLLLFTISLLLLCVYHGVSTRIDILAKAANNIRKGDLDVEVNLKGHDELAVVGDAFEEMRLQLKADQLEKIRAENNQKQLISNIAHDLKTPLTAIRGYAEGLRDGVANTPEKQDAYLRTIQSKAEEIDRLINELTMYSKLDMNDIPYNYRELSVRDYFLDISEEIGVDMESQGVALEYHNFVPEDTMLVADPEQLGRAIHNVVSNSVKYHGDAPLRIQLRIKDVGDFIQVEIEDNGRGIPSKDLPHIFDRMYRGDASRTSAIRGSGIGLSIVKKIVEDQGGQVWATSEENVGTVLYFALRKYLPPEELQSEEASEENSGRRGRRGHR
ncbi:MAG: HAMP domain-containing histidine kinase [Lachnospiraceae bacterium]|nr:HAMP domain-containing histidine kinase [Lachnospiraceae bacterium]